MSGMSREMERLDRLIDECSVGVDVDHGLIMYIRGAIATLARETEELRSQVKDLQERANCEDARVQFMMDNFVRKED